VAKKVVEMKLEAMVSCGVVSRWQRLGGAQEERPCERKHALAVLNQQV
jgi:hypothetical protein